MPKVIVASGKGAYEIPIEKLQGGIDLPFSPATLRGAEPKEVEISSDDVRVVGAVDVVSLYRYPLGEDKFLDVIVAYPNEARILGIGVPDPKREGELAYLPETDEIVGKPVSEFSIGAGIPLENVVNDWKIMVEDGTVDELDKLSPEDREFIKTAVSKDLTPEERKKLYELTNSVFQSLSKRERRTFFPETYAETVKRGIEEVREPKTLTLDEIVKNGQKFSLNSVVVGATKKGDVIVLYSPERVKLASSTAVAKALNSRIPEFRALNYATGIRSSIVFNDERKKKTVKKLLSYAEQVKSPEVKEYLTKLAKAVESGRQKLVEKGLRKGFELKAKVIKEFLKGEPLFNVKDLIVKTGDKRFLRSAQVSVGIPLMDFEKLHGISLVAIPRPIKVEGEWRIQKSVKPIGALIKEDGKYKTVEIDSDSYAMKFDYPVWKVLNNLIKGEYSWKQVRALLSDGFENFKGLGALEREFGQYKGASAIYVDLIKHVKGVLSDLIYKTDEEISRLGEENAKKQLAEKILSDPFLKDYYESFKNFLDERARKKIVKFSKLVKGDYSPKDLINFLIEKGIIYKSNKGYYFYNPKALKAHKEELKELFRIRPETAVLYVKNTLNATLYLRELKVPKEAENDAKILYEDLKNALLLMPPEDLGRKKYLSVVIESWKKEKGVEETPETTEEVKKEAKKEGATKKAEKKAEPSKPAKETPRETPQAPAPEETGAKEKAETTPSGDKEGALNQPESTTDTETPETAEETEVSKPTSKPETPKEELKEVGEEEELVGEEEPPTEEESLELLDDLGDLNLLDVEINPDEFTTKLAKKLEDDIPEIK